MHIKPFLQYPNVQILLTYKSFRHKLRIQIDECSNNGLSFITFDNYYFITAKSLLKSQMEPKYASPLESDSR